MSDSDYKSHHNNSVLRTPIIKSLYDKIKIDDSNSDIKDYNRAKQYNILLHPNRLERMGIIYPYLLTDSLINVNKNPMTTTYYMSYYRSSFEFLDISGAYPVRIDYKALAQYTHNLRGSRVIKRVNQRFIDDNENQDYTVADKENFLEYKFNFMSGSENRSSVWKTKIGTKYNVNSFDGESPLGYLYLTKEDVLELFELKDPNEWNVESFELQGGHNSNQGCSLCDGDFDITCECSDGVIVCQECEEGQTECVECGGGGYGTCDDCDGDGRITCDECEGRGEGGDYGTCPDCEGDGEKQEECPECENGKVDCDECDATGKDDDGEECWQCDGSKKMDCPTCDGYNEIKETCENCDGSGEVGCDYCGAEGEIECNACNGEGEVEGGCDYCDYGRVDCDECGGGGEEECPVCEGAEYVRCIFDEGVNLNEVRDNYRTQEPFSATYDWKLNRGKINPERDVYWIVEDIDFHNWYEADISKVKEYLRQWSDDNMYESDNSMFGKLSNFYITYTLATPKGFIKNALRVFFVWDDNRNAFSVIRIEGGLGAPRKDLKLGQYQDKTLVYYYLGGIRLLNWNQLDFNNLKY